MGTIQAEVIRCFEFDTKFQVVKRR